MPIEDLVERFGSAHGEAWCKGFAVGRTIFWDAAETWFSGVVDDEEAVRQFGDVFTRLSQTWPAAEAT